MGRREDKKRETRERLRAEAFRLFEERGYEETTVQEVARAAGVSTRTAFRYFATKSDLVFLDLGDELERLVGLVRDRPPGEPPFAAARNALVEFAPSFDSPLNLRRTRIAESYPTLYRHSLELRDRWADAIGEALVARGGSGPTEVQRRLIGHVALAAALWGMRVWNDEGRQRRELSEVLGDTLDSVPRLVTMPP